MAGPVLRIGFLHPDLGLGGAERLVVDAASGLAKLGHEVTMFTSHYEPERCFDETRDGTFPVIVHGDWLPRHIAGRLHILFASVRSLWLAARVCVRPTRYDVLIVDQISACVPLLRLLCPQTRILFYCHFPDRLLVQNRKGFIKQLYRLPFDLVEELTTGLAHHILVNSGFTRQTFINTFAIIRKFQRIDPSILYPCIELGSDDDVTLSSTKGPLRLLSINRYERKKAIHLALHALAAMREMVSPEVFGSVHLIIAGGYDTRVAENVEYYEELVQLAQTLGLNPTPGGSGGSDKPTAQETVRQRGARAVPSSSSSPFPPSSPAVTFIRSFTDAEKRDLLRSCGAVVYTPSHEHFGIVPLETMAAQRPVIAVNNGGPTETVVHQKTGFLCEPTAEAFGAAFAALATNRDISVTMGLSGRERVRALFSRQAFARSLEGTCVSLVREGQVQGNGRVAWALMVMYLLIVFVAPVVLLCWALV